MIVDCKPKFESTIWKLEIKKYISLKILNIIHLHHESAKEWNSLQQYTKKYHLTQISFIKKSNS